MSTPPSPQQQQQQQQVSSSGAAATTVNAAADNNATTTTLNKTTTTSSNNNLNVGDTLSWQEGTNNKNEATTITADATTTTTSSTTTTGQWTTVVQKEESDNNNNNNSATTTSNSSKDTTTTPPPPAVKKNTFCMRLVPTSSSSGTVLGGVSSSKPKRRKKRKLFHNILGTTTAATTTMATAATAYSSSGSSGGSSGDSSGSEDEEAITGAAAGVAARVDNSSSSSRAMGMLSSSSSSLTMTMMGKSSSSSAAAAAHGKITSSATMEEQQQQQRQHESSANAAAATAPLSEAETTKGATPPTTTTSPTNAASPSTASSPPLAQPEGWRVKLYRLNADGSWDDCGTGRIVCLYRQQQGNNMNTTTNNNNIKKTMTITTTAASDSTKQQQQQRDNTANSSNTSTTSSSPSSSSAQPTLPIGSDAWLYQETGEGTLCVHAEVTKLQNRQPRVLLRTRILLRDAYQRQGDNIITWCEPYYTQQQQQQQQQRGSSNNNTTNTNNNNNGVDLALSFQDNAGCLDIWRQITHIQQRAAELLRQSGTRSGNNNSSSYRNRNSNSTIEQGSVEDMAVQVAAEHHADLQRQQQEELWAHLTNDDDNTNENNINEQGISLDQQQQQLEAVALPHPPTMQNLEEIADTIAALQHTQQREALAMWIAKDECVYLTQLLKLFPDAESKGDYGKLATLAACVKTVLLLNDPSILELIVTVEGIFEQVCSCLEYDPDLRDKANHRWFLRERAKFRTVVPMEDPELVSSIHRSFRVNYLRDTLLRPTMDESALGTLSSLQSFTHADVVKGVMMSGTGEEVDLKDSYLVRVIRMLGVELHTLSMCEWMDLEDMPAPSPHIAMDHHIPDDFPTDPSIVVGKHASLDNTTWKQYLAPQDHSLASRRLRKRGCLSFLRELFNMVRLSLQPCDKDNFFSVICELDIDLNEEREIPDNVSQTSQIVEVGSIASTVRSSGLDDKTDTPQGVEVPTPSSPVKLLSILGSVLSDHNTDVTERGFALEIISGIAMHDPSIIRQSCLEFHETWKKEVAKHPGAISGRPEANEKKQIVFFCPPYDLLASLLFLLDVETDAGVLLQVSEIMRIILDTDVIGDHVSLGAGFADEAEGIPPGSGQAPMYDQHNQPTGVAATSTDQKQFLSLFYDHYIEWLVTPFQFTTLHPCRPVPHSVLLSPDESRLMQRMLQTFKRGVPPGDRLLKTVRFCAVRGSFAVELLSFCVRAHLYRMKFFLLKSRVMGNVLKLLRPHPAVNGMSGDRCLKLAALRFLRAILSVNDELYHRHIVQHDLFAPVFEAFRANPVGDNLVSSAIVEMCDYIHTENIKSLLEYIVTKHLSATHPENTAPSLEDVSSPYVSTLTVLRRAYEANLKGDSMPPSPINTAKSLDSLGGSRYFGGNGTGRTAASVLAHHPTRHLNGKALEDQRKFQAVDEEESYFDSDDDDTPPTQQQQQQHHPTVVDEVDAAQQLDRELLHRTPRMFSLTPAPAPPILAHPKANNSGNENSPIGGG